MKTGSLPGRVEQSTSGFNCIFIHSSLDDAGLSANEFRLYAHLSRRAGSLKGGEAFASAETMAKVCRMHPDTVWKCLKALQGRHMVERRTRPGQSTVFVLTSPDEWRKQEPTRNEGVPESEGCHPPETEGCHPPESKGCEGNPTKVIPDKEESAPVAPTGGKDKKAKVVEVKIPANLQSEDFIEVWVEYRQHRKETHKPLTPTAERNALLKLSRYPEVAVAAVRQTLENGWQGVFPEKLAGNGYSIPRNGQPAPGILRSDADVDKLADDLRRDGFEVHGAGHLPNPGRATATA